MSKANEQPLDKIRRLILENPTLPIVFFCSTDEILDEYYMTVFEDFSCDVVTIYKTDEMVFDHEIDIEEYYQDIYEDATDEEIKERINNTTQYKAIRVYCK